MIITAPLLTFYMMLCIHTMNSTRFRNRISCCFQLTHTHTHTHILSLTRRWRSMRRRWLCRGSTTRRPCQPLVAASPPPTPSWSTPPEGPWPPSREKRYVQWVLWMRDTFLGLTTYIRCPLFRGNCMGQNLSIKCVRYSEVSLIQRKYCDSIGKPGA